MIVSVVKPGDEYEEQRRISDAIAVVIDPVGYVRICRFGKMDEDIDTDEFAVVVRP